MESYLSHIAVYFVFFLRTIFIRNSSKIFFISVLNAINVRVAICCILELICPSFRLHWRRRSLRCLKFFLIFIFFLLLLIILLGALIFLLLLLCFFWSLGWKSQNFLLWLFFNFLHFLLFLFNFFLCLFLFRCFLFLSLSFIFSQGLNYVLLIILVEHF